MRPVLPRTRFMRLRVSSNALGQITASDPAELPPARAFYPK